MHAGIALYLADECPVCLSGVHLAPCPAVDGQGFGTGILYAFGQVHDEGYAFAVCCSVKIESGNIPSQAGLDGYRDTVSHTVYHAADDVQHEVGGLEHTRSCTFACHTLDGASEI